MTDEQRAEHWRNVNYIMELVKGEGDRDCERAFDFLVSECRVTTEAIRMVAAEMCRCDACVPYGAPLRCSAQERETRIRSLLDPSPVALARGEGTPDVPKAKRTKQSNRSTP